MNEINIQYFKSPVGELILGSFEQALCLCDWRYRKMRTGVDQRITKHLKAVYVEKNDVVIEQAIEELTQYFQRERTVFDTPLLFAGTEFQKSVWQQLTTITYGETVSYLTLADKVGNTKAVRAVASANGANALSIFVPCHRVIGKNNTLVGYAGGLDAKQKLLDIEYDLFV